MTKILVVTGSVRPGSVNSKLVPKVAELVKVQGVDVEVADLAVIDLPFLNSPVSPNSDDFVITDESVKEWTKMVDQADGVLLVSPEYNHTMTPVQLNAIDWIGKQWKGKPVGIVSYGWTSGGAMAAATATEALGATLGAKVGGNQSNLFFMKDITPEAEFIEDSKAREKVNQTIKELISASKA